MNTYFDKEYYVYKGKLEDEFVNSLLKKTLALRKLKLNKVLDADNSLVGSFPHHGQFFLGNEINSQITKAISPHLIDYIHSFGIDDIPAFKVDDAWVNISDKNAYNPLHFHSFDFSGVLYLQSDQSSGGKIAFKYGHDAPENLFFEGLQFFNPSKGDMVLFPNWQQHIVFPTLDTETERISIAFNVQFETPLRKMNQG